MGQFRFVHVGVAAALAAASMSVVGLVREVGAAGSGTASSFVPIVPCRLADTRGTSPEGSRHTPLTAAETVTFAVWGTNGNCTIPNTATGIATNVTAVGPTADSYLTVFPADANPRPTASNLNVTSTSPPTPNQVTVALSATGAIAIYNNGGSVNVIVDIVGYYIPAGGGGTQGLPGAPGVPGVPGVPGAPGPACPTSGCIAFYTGVDASDLIPTTRAVDSSGCLALASSTYAYLFLNLPSGALIDSVRIRYKDSTAGSSNRSQFALRSYIESGSINGPASSVLVAPDAPSIAAVTLQLLPGLPAQARDVQYAVFLEIYGSGQYICGAEVSYHF